MEDNQIKEINSKAELDQVINTNNDKFIIIDFMAEWCGPCRMLKPTLNSIAQENPEIEIVSVNVDNNMELAQEYGIRGIPAVHIYKNGAEVTKFTGLKPKNEILNLLS